MVPAASPGSKIPFPLLVVCILGLFILLNGMVGKSQETAVAAESSHNGVKDLYLNGDSRHVDSINSAQINTGGVPLSPPPPFLSPTTPPPPPLPLTTPPPPPLPATSVSSVKVAPVPSAPCPIPAGSSVAVIQPSRINVKCDKGSFKSVIYDSSVPNNRDAVSVEIENKGFAFDQEAREIMAALNAHPGPFLDIGANLGWFTTMVTACTDKITYAIEPFVENFNRILASACENEVPSSRLHAYNIGLDTKSSKCSLYQVPDHNKGDTHSICDEEQKAAFAARKYIELGIMQTAPLDSLYSSGQLGDVPFSLMKIDVEGYELNSILSASAFLSSSIAPQCINIEMDSRRSQEASSWHVDCEAYIGGLRVILRGYGYRHEVSDNLNSKEYCPKFDGQTLMFCKPPK